MNDKATILVVDDTPELLSFVAGRLRAAGYNVRPADSGELALVAVAENLPDLILLDVRMKGMDGLEVCRRLKAAAETRNIPVILMSGFAEVGEWVEGFELGAADYINKPFQTAELLARVRTHLSLGWAMRSLEEKTTTLRQANEQLQAEIVARQHIEDELRRSLERTERSRRALLSALEDQKRADSEMLASEMRYRRLFEAAQDGILILDAHTGRVVDVNPFLAKLLGYSHDEFLGKGIWELGPFKDIVASKEAFGELQEKKYIRYDALPLETRDGRQIAVEFVSNEYSAGLIRVVQCNIRDITERRKLEEQLQASQKMEAIGSLAGGVAHDFNNLLCVLLSYTDFALSALRDGDPIRDDLLAVKRAGERAATLTRQLLAFSRKQVLQPVPLILNDVASAMERMLRRIVGEDIEYEQVLASDIGVVRADQGQIEQVLMNLVVNARDAMPEGGKLTIATSNVEIDAESAGLQQGMNPGAYVQIVVTDTGSGIDQQTKARMFEPFFTTKDKGKGTGLGLSTVYGIVKQSGGGIWVESEVGKGATFRICLPRDLGGAATVAKSVASERYGAGTETILLVEDEEELRRVAQRSLQAAGYSVLSAADGEEALRISADYAGDIHMLLTDVVMPHMGGRVLAQQLGKTRPATVVLYMSGYTDDAILHHGLLEAGIHLLGKPFTSTGLAHKVREVLDGASGAARETFPPMEPAAEMRERQLDASALRELSEEVVVGLRQAVLAARYDEMMEIVERLRPTAPEVAEALRQRVDCFDYEGILEWVGRPRNGGTP